MRPQRKRPIAPALQAAAYEARLAERVGELLPDLNVHERLALPDAMGPDDMYTALAWIAMVYPQVFDFAFVRDRAIAERFAARLDEDDEDELDPYCCTCGSLVGIFIGHGDGWHHFRGEGTVASPVTLLNADHSPSVAWRPAGAR